MIFLFLLHPEAITNEKNNITKTKCLNIVR
jgi:hypothetical protein